MFLGKGEVMQGLGRGNADAGLMNSVSSVVDSVGVHSNDLYMVYPLNSALTGTASSLS